MEGPMLVSFPIDELRSRRLPRAPSPLPSRRATWLAASLLMACGDSGEVGGGGQGGELVGGQGGEGGLGGQGGEGGAIPAIEPDLPPAFTLVSSYVDRDRAQFCWLESPADPDDPATPFPPGGLAFGKAQALTEELLPPGKDLELITITGDVSAERCRDLVDDPALFPDLEITSLGVAPKSVFETQRSLILAPTGCVGGDHAEKEATAICGPGYAASAPNPSLLFIQRSRLVDPTKIGFQVGSALGDIQAISIKLRPAVTDAEFAPIAGGVGPGTLVPFPPAHIFDEVTLGAATNFGIQVTGEGPPIELTLGEALTGSGDDALNITVGTNVALLVLGSRPGLGEGFWNPAKVIAWVTRPAAP